ncbi:hypothetical protein C8F04DRAFT_1269348 [Mycena alexandri]|uniref:Uncharacterized protein n=1 Tax=Mycena alexandri TaxID=1745969 RepID=A0AAD6SD19_9AGAR|nr:hypothetical protein C8F04DRAFT_1269348 [Mycena alexandri]
MSQHIKICGLQSTTFKEAMEKTQEVTDRFVDHLAGVKVVDLPRPNSVLGPVLSASNRIFTAKDECPTEQDNEFAEGLDPVGTLAKMKTQNLIHAPENMVNINVFEAAKSGNAVPGLFKVGDLVELQVSFVAIHVSREVKITYKVCVQEALAARREFASQPKKEPAVRRKIGYFYADEEEPSRIAKRHDGE